MDQKNWPWRKRSSEKTIVKNGKADLSSKGTAEQVQLLSNEKETILEESVKVLEEKLASIVTECDAKDELVANHAKAAQEAMTGREKAEAELLCLRKDLEQALRQRGDANDRLSHLNTALKDTMQQLSSLKEEQEQRIRDAIMRTSEKFEKAHKSLEEKLADMSRNLTDVTDQNARLNEVLFAKEKLVVDLRKCKSQAEAEFSALLSRLDSTEKENAFLRYEFRMLEKELEIRIEEIEFSRRSADLSYKKHLESIKKVKKLEAECQQFRSLARKQLPGPATPMKMKGEVEMRGRNQADMKRKKGILKTSSLLERLSNVEEDNKVLKQMLATKDDEICYLQNICSQIVLKASSAEAQLGQLTNFQGSMETALCDPAGEVRSSSSGYLSANGGSNMSSVPWSSSLIREFKGRRSSNQNNSSDQKIIGTSDMSLMDDFVEMEKLAIVSVDFPPGSSHGSSDMSHALSDSLWKEICGDNLESVGKELVAMGGDDLNNSNRELQISDSPSSKPCDWLQKVLELVLEQSHVSQRSLEELVDEIRIALHNMNYPSTFEASKTRSSMHSEPDKLLPVSGYITWKSPETTPRASSFKGTPDVGIILAEEKSNEVAHYSLGRSICKIIEIIQRLEQAYLDKHQTKASSYLIHVFLWRSCELTAVLHKFIGTCNDLLDGRANFEKFVSELMFTLEWIMDGCVSCETTSSMRDKFMKHSNHGGEGTEAELKSLQDLMLEIEKAHSALRVENKGLKTDLDFMKSSKNDMEARLQSERDKNDSLAYELQHSQTRERNLQEEVESLKEMKRTMEDQIENHKLIAEDLDTQLTVSRVKSNEVLQKLSSLEVELEHKSHCCQELEGTCLELQLQLESIANKEIPKQDKEDTPVQTGWEISAASAKLAECQETILNLGKQLKDLSLPKNTSVIDVISTSNKKLNQRFTLLDQMISEDGAEMEDLESPKTKEIISTTETGRSCTFHSRGSGDRNTQTGALVIVPTKKRRAGISFVSKLLFIRKRGSTRRTAFSPMLNMDNY